MKENLKKHKVFLIACEASGDVAASKIMLEMKRKYPNIEFQGVGGDTMIAAGLDLVFHCREIAVMGFFEVLPKIPQILRRIREVLGAIDKFQPDMLVTIDGPAFNFRIVKKVRKRFDHIFPIVHYVAPTVWAYKKERAKLVAELYDHILLLLPFEKPYFDEVGIDSTFIGHHILESKKSEMDEKDLRSKFNIPVDAIPILIMPGSRKQEVKFMGEVFNQAMMRLQDQYGMKCVGLVPTAPHLSDDVHKVFGGTNTIVSSNPDDKLEFFKLAKAGIIKSGTSSLEAAVYDIPAVVAYKMSAFSYAYIKRLVRVKFVSIVNLLIGKMVIPELIQKDCTPDKISANIVDILSADKSHEVRREYHKALSMLKNTAKIPPSEYGAEILLNLLKGM